MDWLGQQLSNVKNAVVGTSDPRNTMPLRSSFSGATQEEQNNIDRANDYYKEKEKKSWNPFNTGKGGRRPKKPTKKKPKKQTKNKRN